MCFITKVKVVVTQNQQVTDFKQTQVDSFNMYCCLVFVRIML